MGGETWFSRVAGLRAKMFMCGAALLKGQAACQLLQCPSSLGGAQACGIRMAVACS